MKHAFLIISHNNFSVLKILLQQLDHKDFDIFVHVDAKTRAFPMNELENSVKHVAINFVPRINVGWAEYSLLNAVKTLMITASQTFHDYYHVISGSDLMIASIGDFINFFESHNGIEFVGFSESYTETMTKYRHYFAALGHSKLCMASLFFIKLRKSLIAVQKILKLEKRIDYEIKKGTDWYSITHDALKFIIQEEPKFRKFFYRAFCPTEFLAQTILWNSDFRNRLYQPKPYSEGAACLRYIDWQRGTPYTYSQGDIDELLNVKGYMFARKFDENLDMNVVNAVFLKYHA